MPDISLEAIMRQNYSAFCHKGFITLHPDIEFDDNFHLEAIAYKMEKCIKGENTRLIINLPPRSGKTLFGSVFSAAWALGQNPSKKIIIVTYADELSKQIMRHIKQLMQESWYKSTFPSSKISPAKNTEALFETTENGGVFVTTVGSTLTGFGADIIIVDDPMKPGDMKSDPLRSKTNEWYKSTLRTRLNNVNTGSIIVIMQRLHQDDLTGHILPLEKWTHLNLPAKNNETRSIKLSDKVEHLWLAGDLLHPSRLNNEALKKIRRVVGEYLYNAQYQQTPIPVGGNMIDPSWFGTYDPSKALVPDSYVQVWDTATDTGENHDYSVCLTFGIIGKHTYLADMYREKVQYPTLRKAAIDRAKHFEPKTIVVEKTNVGFSLIPELRIETGLNIIADTPKHSKEERLASVSHYIEMGVILLPKQGDKFHPSVQTYIDELTGFPYAKNDDLVDATSLFLKWYNKLGPGNLMPSPGGFCLYDDGSIKNY